MKREVDLRDISDGKLYMANDMVKAETGGCKGCSECCRSMVGTIVLDPWDVYHLTARSGYSFNALTEAGKIELNVVDGLIMPNLKVQEDTEACGFLDEAGRCTIHDARPGFCRLFPLGRYYENRDFKYFVQVHECTNPNLTKVKVKKWLGIADLKKYEDYIRSWHFFMTDVEEMLDGSSEEALRKEVCVYLLQQFFLLPWKTGEDFYPQFDERLVQAKIHLGWTD